jgi:teichuronic acid exporter
VSLKKKAISGFTWSFSENIANSVSNFLIGVALARLLFPEDFGLVGIAFAFLAFIAVFTDGGFAVALLQKKECTEEDYSSVFFFNLAFSLAFYLLLFVCAPWLALFFDQAELTSVVRLAGVTIIINSFSAIQLVLFSKQVDFKTISIITVSSNFISGTIAVILAVYHFGVWSLVYRALIQSVLSVGLFFFFSTWRPKLIFHLANIKSLFSFGSKLLVGNLLDKLFQNAFYFVIGKVYSPSQLGQYSRADMFSKIPSQNLLGVVQKVSFPILVELKGNDEKLLSGYRSLIQNTMLISFLAMFCLAASAESIVMVLIGEVWRPSILYLQLLCFSAVLFPLHALNLNMITIHGRSDIVLRLEVIKKILMIPVIALGVFYSIEWMLYGMIVFSIVAYFLNATFASGFVNYPIARQLNDLMPSFFYAVAVGAVVAVAGRLPVNNYLIIFGVQSLLALFSIVLIGELGKIKPYMELKSIIVNKVLRKK